jgi:hypothetical protein
VLRLNDSWGDGWGSSSVSVNLNGNTQNYTVSGSGQQVLIPVWVTSTVILSYTATGPDQDENSYSLSYQSGGPLYNSGTPPPAPGTFAYTVDCDPAPMPQEDCLGSFTICNDQGFNNNTNNAGFIDDLVSSNFGCIIGGEHQGTWYVFSPSAAGNLGFTLTPVSTTDYDWAIWGPFPSGSNPGNICPPPGPPIRCASSSGPATFNNTGSYATGMGHPTFSPPRFNTTAVTYSIPPTTDFCPSTAPQRCGWITGMQVNIGEVYLMYIDNYDESGLAFDLSWTLENGASLDCTVLPMGQLELEADLRPASVELDWTVLIDLGDQAFQVERSNNGTSFEPIGQVASSANQRFSFTDARPERGMNYYRILVVDQYGQQKSSNVVSALFGGGLAPVVVPNPVTDKATLSLGSELPADALLRIVDARGRTLRQQRLPGSGTRYALDLQGLSSGVYSLLISDPDGLVLDHVRFVKD